MSLAARFKLADRWPYLVLAGLAAAFAVMMVFSRKAPSISSLDPEMAAPGETVTISGEYFGRTEREGTLNIAGEIPPPSLIQTWSDQKIVFTVPEDVSSGLVSISNSQGVSPGVLFTNTRSIPTVLQAAGDPTAPLLWAAVPARGSPGSVVTLQGRGFGAGDEPVVLVFDLGQGGPILEWTPAQTLRWSPQAVRFRLPAGGTAASAVRIRTARGESPVFALPVSSPLTYRDPLTASVEFRVEVTGAEGHPVTLWGPVPDPESGTRWTLISGGKTPAGGPLVLTVPVGKAGTRQASYRLELTSWARQWQGFPPGAVPADQAPDGSSLPRQRWKPAAAALKTLTAKWGLESPDPWTRLQKIQAGLASAFVLDETGSGRDLRAPAVLLAAKTATPAELADLAAALASGTGLPVRPVAGLFLDASRVWQSRLWTEVWLAGAGWVPWDPAEGGPGNLSARHFAFDTGALRAPRSLPKAEVIAGPAAGSLSLPSGETTGTGARAVWRLTAPAN